MANPKKTDEAQTQKAARSAIGSANQHVLDFLRKCTAYQADAVRVMIDVATDGIQSVSKDEINLIHSYLNQGYYKEDGNEYNKLMQHRQHRAEILLESVSPFLEKDKMIPATMAIMKLSNDEEVIEKKRMNLPNRPVETNHEATKQS